MNLFANYTDKDSAMSDLRESAAKFAPNVCPDHSLVWGEGNLGARLAIVGEAPGDKEEKLSRPFIGPAGSLLDKELHRSGIDRGDTWVTNVVKCRPTREINGRVTNRPPTAKEVGQWMPFLSEELSIIRPEVIVCLGAVAASAIIHRDFRMTSERGVWFESIVGPPAIATFHPAYILRQLDNSWDRSIAAFRTDLLTVEQRLRNAA